MFLNAALNRVHATCGAFLRLRRMALLKASMLAVLIYLPVWAADFEIPSVPVSLSIGGQTVAVVLSGRTKTLDAQSMGLTLRADLSDFRTHLTPILQAELNKSERCGERIAVEDATLTSAAESAHLTVRLHVERWVCIKAFGKENAKRLLGGNAVVELTLAPHPDAASLLRLDASVDRIDADGSLGDVLRSGTPGDMIKDKIRESLLKSLRKATDLAPLIPDAVRPMLSVQNAEFERSADDRLSLRLDGSLQIPSGGISSLEEQLRGRK